MVADINGIILNVLDFSPGRFTYISGKINVD